MYLTKTAQRRWVETKLYLGKEMIPDSRLNPQEENEGNG